jgi:hypothetical protein
MLKITDQYFWNLVFLTFFFALVVLGAIILDTESRLAWSELTWFDVGVIALATWRLTRFLAVDNTTKFFREQFYDLKKTARTISLERPVHGPRRTIIDLLTNHYNLGLFLAAVVIFVYLITPYAVYPLTFLALAGVVSLLELIVERLGGE